MGDLGLTVTQSRERIGGKSSIVATDAGSLFKSNDLILPIGMPEGNLEL